MLNKKGQALIEFVLILPVLLMLIFAFIDFGMILVEKNELINLTNDVIDKMDDINTYEGLHTYLNDISDKETELYIAYSNDGEVTIKLERSVNLVTPGLNLIIGSPYKVTSERVVVHE